MRRGENMIMKGAESRAPGDRFRLIVNELIGLQQRGNGGAS